MTALCKCFLLLLVFWAGQDRLVAGEEQPKSDRARAKVVCFGDSITNRGYYEILAKRLGVDTVNAGVGGNSTAKGLRRISSDVLSHSPDVVVILFGTNDLRADADKVYVPVEQYKANLEIMVARCRNGGARVVLCTLPPIERKAFFTRHELGPFEAHGGLDAMIERYRDAARQVASAQKTSLVDLNRLLAQEPSWMSKDGVHPSEKGNSIIAEHIVIAVAPLVNKTESSAR